MAVLGIALALSCIPLQTCLAQEINIKLNPSISELTIEPGATQTLGINVLNNGAVDLRLRIYYMDYTVTPDNRTTFKEPGHYSFSCARWITTEKKEFALPAGREETVPFSVTVPPDAEPGTHNAIIFFEVILQPEVEGEAVVRSTGRVGAVVLVTVPGLIVREGGIKSVSVQSRWFWPSKNMPVIGGSLPEYTVVFENTGNVHLTTKGVLYYNPSFGWGTGSVQLPEMTVLPHTERRYRGTLPNPPLLGSYDVEVEIMYGPSMFEFDTVKTGSTAFNVYPLFILLALVVLVSLLAAAVNLLKRFTRKRKATEAEAGEEGKKREKPGDGRRKNGAGEESQPEERWVELIDVPGDGKEALPEEEKDSSDAGEQDDTAGERQEEAGEQKKEGARDGEEHGDGEGKEDAAEKGHEEEHKGPETEEEKPRKPGSGKLNLRSLFRRGGK